jgi:two-component system cell cycle response regulator DivK
MKIRFSLRQPRPLPIIGPMIHSGAPLVLVVEDEPETRRCYAEALTTRGFRVEQAHNGHQALEKAFATRPNLILTDIAVPGIDGIELCQRLRADTRTADVPVLAITGYDDRHYPVRAVEAGADYVLIKPCEPELIVAEACRLLAERRDRAHADVSR